MSSLCSVFGTEPAMPHHIGPGLCSPAQEPQRDLSHPQIKFLSDPPALYNLCQKSAPHNDGRDFEETAFDAQQYQSPSRSPSFHEADWSWLDEVEAQPPHSRQERQVTWPCLLIQGADTTRYTNKSDSASSGQSSPSVLGDWPPYVALNLPQYPHGVSSGRRNTDLYPPTPEGSSPVNWNTGKYSRNRTENNSSGLPRDILPTQWPAGADSDSDPDYPTVRPNHRAIRNHCHAPQRKEQDKFTKSPYRKCPPVTCEPCSKTFQRLSDLTRHLRTTRAHGPANGPFCPISDCEYSKKRLTRGDNLRPHLVKVHGFTTEEAAGQF